jgi:mannonate dehydratase
MKMAFRWYGEGNDTVTLKQIKQIPGVETIVWALYDIPAGQVWPLEKINEVTAHVEQSGFKIDVVESVNICKGRVIECGGTGHEH